MKIGISGKGGVGKTTTSATLARIFAARGYDVLAIDGDPNPNLALALGFPPEVADTMQPMPRRAFAKDSELTYSVDEILARYGVKGPQNISLVLGAKIEHAASG
ncbi:MAG: AAA family ATPase [Chloroflexi bacterium]|nr:AAA family ATPase [Chloroflexota bacterium]